VLTFECAPRISDTLGPTYSRWTWRQPRVRIVAAYIEKYRLIGHNLVKHLLFFLGQPLPTREHNFAFSARGAVSIVELFVYLPSLVAATILCKHHGFTRSSGWVLTLILCLVRIIGAYCQLDTYHDKSSGLVKQRSSSTLSECHLCCLQC